jgi:hypothetical protein
VEISDNIVSGVFKSRRIRWAGYVACCGGKRNAHKILVGQSEGEKLLGRPRCMWEDKVKADIKMAWTPLNWLRIAFVGGLL